VVSQKVEEKGGRLRFRWLKDVEDDARAEYEETCDIEGRIFVVKEAEAVRGPCRQGVSKYITAFCLHLPGRTEGS
jgi:predicted fused transcriptional regulator/phosphomethylpyrimidine kinase